MPPSIRWNGFSSATDFFEATAIPLQPAISGRGAHISLELNQATMGKRYLSRYNKIAIHIKKLFHLLAFVANLDAHKRSPRTIDDQSAERLQIDDDDRPVIPLLPGIAAE